jgi:hypothetical protein
MNELTDEQIDELLERFDQTDPALQRRIIARLVADRTVLLDACEAVLAANAEYMAGDSAMYPDGVMGAINAVLRPAVDQVTRRPRR